MKKINLHFSHFILVLVSILVLSFAYKGDKDAMHKRIFDLDVVEYRDGKPKPKSEKDEL